ncbi:MAG: hypothetical protein JRI94_00075 [Deltaproteobacteria bacterium]|nr:hypothetical protein [Deltaproteobacteria bacterium]MBW2031978.1 hypothetical protein [Deltaproteobacteria bacterium]
MGDTHLSGPLLVEAGIEGARLFATEGVKKVATVYAANVALGDVDFPTDYIELDGTLAAVGITEFTPTPGKTYVFVCSNSTEATTLTASSGVTLDGTNDVVTFVAANDILVLFAVSATKCLVVANPQTLTFS